MVSSPEAQEHRPTILLVDDERQIIEFLRMGFEYEGFTVHVAMTGHEALQAVERHKPDIVILDLMLPGLDGMAVAQQLHGIYDTAIIMLTAREEVEDRVAGLELGADDYVTKPFAFKELLARVRAVLRRRGLQLGNVLVFQDITLNRTTRVVRRGTREIELTPREFELLELFLSHPRQVLTRNAILARIWGYNYVGDDNVIEVYVKHLREKLQDLPPQLLQTVRGVGYVLREVKS
ncbi:DNA-binding response regulator [Ktedonobacter sp. SOSP1-85]|uniref:response regulator transcription factor n=1 Tax=Ktedonobacter sp. SOSP1-85 TaxID=2778367 RepID=UPI0019168C4E|nr:response regulator transcription factor [Ktedonobacter sp. SOSP1-85]GHO75320.1 DNA-binding response regulator [Ktedonobacter sp. SOSP1-85]